MKKRPQQQSGPSGGPGPDSFGLQSISTEQNPKVAIPAAAKSTSRPLVSGKARTSLACEFCRQKRVKCDGAKPACGRCTAAMIPCVYAKERRNRSKELQRDMDNVLREYRSLLQDLNTRNIPGIDPRLQDSEISISPARSDVSGSGDINTPQFPENLVGFFDSLLSQKELDGRPNSPTEQVGFSSDSFWVRQLGQRLGASQEFSGDNNEPEDLIQKLNESHLYDSEEGSFPDNSAIDPYVLPEPTIARTLVECFFSTIHSSYPFLDRTSFSEQFRTIFREKARAKSNAWLAILNIVFAICASYGEQSKAVWHDKCESHAVYLARAKALALKRESLQGTATFEQLQLLCLTSLYFFTTNRFGVASEIVRAIVQMGFNGLLAMKLKSEASGVSARSAMAFWGALYCLEVALYRIKGIGVESSGLYFLEAQILSFINQVNEDTLVETSDSSEKVSDFAESAYLSFRLRLCRILRLILTEMYSEESGSLNDELLRQVTELDDKLIRWKILIPSFLDFEIVQADQVFARQRMALALQYFDSKGLVHRPFLHMLSSGEDFDRENLTLIYPKAEMAVNSARSTIASLPEDFDASELMVDGPWWAILPHLVTANIILTELMLSGLFGSQSHRIEIMAGLQQDAQKAVKLLEVLALSRNDVAAMKSWETVVLLRHIAANLAQSASDSDL